MPSSDPLITLPDQQANRLKVPFGRLATKIVAPTEALGRGLACGCVCPGCGSELVLKQGKRRRFFAHHNAPGSNRCVESAIHAAAKQVLIEHGALVVPEVAFELSTATVTGQVLREVEVLSSQRWIRFDRTVAEVTIGDIRPDAVGYRGERQLLVEMYFRHRVDPDKREKLRKLGLPALEIDLSDLDQLDDLDAVKERVLESVFYKEWLVYPRVDEHLAYLKQKLQGRVDAANEAHRQEQERHRIERQRLAQLQKAHRLAKIDVDAAFALWTPDQQAEWLREQLGLTNAIPAFLSRPVVPASVLGVPPFLFHASIFERFVYQSKEGTRLRADAIYICLRRRFNLRPRDGQQHRLAINLYLEYLVRARFVHREPKNEMIGPYFVNHSDVSMPFWTPVETRHDGQPLLPDKARGEGALKEWRTPWPRWRAVISEAEELLEQSRHRDLLMQGLHALSGLAPPATPHHWAEPLIARGASLEECFSLLSGLGLM